MSLLKPYFLLACVGFTVGFVGYWALGRAAMIADPPAAASWQAPISSDASTAGDWNIAKHI